jgi:hypothetical protein
METTNQGAIRAAKKRRTARTRRHEGVRVVTTTIENKQSIGEIHITDRFNTTGLIPSKDGILSAERVNQFFDYFVCQVASTMSEQNILKCHSMMHRGAKFDVFQFDLGKASISIVIEEE